MNGCFGCHSEASETKHERTQRNIRLLRRSLRDVTGAGGEYKPNQPSDAAPRSSAIVEINTAGTAPKKVMASTLGLKCAATADVK
jgi:hypothetical protein